MDIDVEKNFTFTLNKKEVGQLLRVFTHYRDNVLEKNRDNIDMVDDRVLINQLIIKLQEEV